jgi:hypothetical protein
MLNMFVNIVVTLAAAPSPGPSPTKWWRGALDTCFLQLGAGVDAGPGRRCWCLASWD